MLFAPKSKAETARGGIDRGTGVCYDKQRTETR